MAAGSFDQYIFVVPEKNVVVFTAHLKETNIFSANLRNAGSDVSERGGVYSGKLDLTITLDVDS